MPDNQAEKFCLSILESTSEIIAGFIIWQSAGLRIDCRCVGFARVRFVVILVALFSPLQAELLAHFQTSLGNVAVVLQYQKAPQAVANFITLAEATRTRIHPLTGAVIRSPLYIGEKFFRVVNDPSFKIAQTGSGTGTNSGGPGFTFRDEFDPTLTHVPYVLSMANSGPNTNGSQIFFTGNTSIPSLNNVHTIFGLITDPASRTVIDAILAAGSDGSTITGLTFSRTDAAAIAFDEQAQRLPAVTCPSGYLTVNVGVSAVWHLSPAMTTGAIFHAFRSTTMAAGSWSELASARLHVGLSAPLFFPYVDSAVLDNAAASKAFYNLSVVQHPDSVAPSTLANRTVTIALGNNSLAFAFDTSGVAGTMTYTPAVGSATGGTFITVSPNTGLPSPPTSDAHSIMFTADSVGFNIRYFWVKSGCDTATNSTISCRHSTQTYNFGWQSFASGSATITR